MVVGFRHKGLRLLFEKGDRRRVSAGQADKIERILARLEEATEPGSMDLPGFRLHPLRGDLSGYWWSACRAIGGSCSVSRAAMPSMWT